MYLLCGRSISIDTRLLGFAFQFSKKWIKILSISQYIVSPQSCLYTSLLCTALSLSQPLSGFLPVISSIYNIYVNSYLKWTCQLPSAVLYWYNNNTERSGFCDAPCSNILQGISIIWDSLQHQCWHPIHATRSLLHSEPITIKGNKCSRCLQVCLKSAAVRSYLFI